MSDKKPEAAPKEPKATAVDATKPSAADAGSKNRYLSNGPHLVRGPDTSPTPERNEKDESIVERILGDGGNGREGTPWYDPEEGLPGER